MLNFKCIYCEREIQADLAHVGEFVGCPFCGADIAVPDPWLRAGTEIQGFVVELPLASSMLWHTYKATYTARDGVEKNALLRVPSEFFRKRVEDFGRFAEVVVRSGTMDVKRIPRLIDYSADAGNGFFAFEFFESLDAGEFTNTYGRLGVYEALGVTRRIATSLRDAWDKYGTVHQNIVPRNIRINGNLKVRIMNFGLSKYLLEDRMLLEQGFNVWDYRYMSPEFAIKGDGATPRCDIYSLGCVLYLLLTGTPPYVDIPPKDIPSAPALDVKFLRHEVSDQVCALVQLMAMRNLATRLASWDEVVERIDRIAGNKKRLKSKDGRRRIILGRRDKPTALATGSPHVGRGRGAERGGKRDSTVAEPIPKDKVVGTFPPGSLSEVYDAGSTARTPRSSSCIVALVVAVAALALVVVIYVLARNSARNSRKGAIQPAERPVAPRPLESSTSQSQPLSGSSVLTLDDAVTTLKKLSVIDEWYDKHPEATSEAMARYKEVADSLPPEERKAVIRRFELKRDMFKREKEKGVGGNRPGARRAGSADISSATISRGKAPKDISQLRRKPKRTRHVAPLELRVKPGADLAVTLASLAIGAKVVLEPGAYRLSKPVVVGGQDISISGAGMDTVVEGGGLTLQGKNMRLAGLVLENSSLSTNGGALVSVENIVCRNTVTTVESDAVAIFRNCLFRGLVVSGSPDVTARHCVFLTPQGRPDLAPLTLDTDAVAVVDSVVYGARYAILQKRPRANRKCVLEHTLIFGEKGLCAMMADESEAEAVLSPSRLGRFLRTKFCLFARPRFRDKLNGDFRLAPDSPGTGAALDGGNCGLTKDR